MQSTVVFRRLKARVNDQQKGPQGPFLIPFSDLIEASPACVCFGLS